MLNNLNKALSIQHCNETKPNAHLVQNDFFLRSSDRKVDSQRFGPAEAARAFGIA